MTYLSQNFLIDKSYIQNILEAADLNHRDMVVEIGSGKGILTEELCRLSKQVIAIETDRKLVGLLENFQKQYANLIVVPGDFNKINWRERIGKRKYKIVANIPYHVTGLILRTIFDCKQSLPERIVLMMQYEVVKKILAKEDDQNILSNLIRSFGEASLVCKVDKKAFRPIPKVDSAVILINNIHKPEIADFNNFFSLIKKGFANRRKTLLNNLSTGCGWPKSQMIERLESIKIDPRRRAQTISYDEWKKIYYVLGSGKN